MRAGVGCWSATSSSGCASSSTGSDRPSEPIPELLEEVERLPERYRAPLVLCYLEGRSHEQAARILGCPMRTVATRLQRGKAKLRTRLVRRGLAPAAGLVAMGVESAGAAPAVLAASVPSALSESTARASVQFAASRAAGLATSAACLARGVIRSLLWNRVRRAAGLVFALSIGLALGALALAAAGQKDDKPGPTIAGRILDDQGRPIPGAGVWMQVGFEDSDDASAHTTTDAQGRYVLPVPATWDRTPMHARQGIVWAHASGHRMNTASAYAALSGKAKSVDLVLGPATDTSFVVFGPDGRPVAGAVVEPHLVLTPVNAYMFPPRAMQPAIRAVTDADGRAALPAMPRAGFRAVNVTVGSLGAQKVDFVDRDTEPARREIRLRPAGRVEGRVIADRPEWARGLKVYVTTTENGDPYRLSFKALGDDIVTTGPDGSFVVPAIAAGKLVVGTQVAEGLPVRPIAPEGLEVRIDQTTRVFIPLVKAVRLRGVIRVQGTGEPIAGASVAVGYGYKRSKLDGGSRPTGSATVVSDAQGRFATYGLPGDATMQVIYMPEPFVQMGQPWAERHAVPEKVEAFDLPPIEVVRGVTIKGRLVDAEGRPLAGLKLSGLAGDRGYGFAITEPQGDFTMSSVPAGLKFSYRVWVDDREPPVDVEIVKEEPLLLRADVGKRPGPATTGTAGVSGTVVDADGRPVEGVEVNLLVETDRSQKRETLTTDARGVYRDCASDRAGDPVPGDRAAGPIRDRDQRDHDGGRGGFPHPAAGRRGPDADDRRPGRRHRGPAGGRRPRAQLGKSRPLSDAVTGPTGRFQLEGFPRERAFALRRRTRLSVPSRDARAGEIDDRVDHPPRRPAAGTGHRVARAADRTRPGDQAGREGLQAVRRSDHQARHRSRGPEPGPRRGGRDRSGRRLAEVPGRGGALGQQPGADHGRPPSRRRSVPRTPRPSSPRSRTTSGARACGSS